MIYRQSKSGSYVDLIRFSGGFVQNVSGTSALNYQPRYYSTDHLGSVRCIVDQNGKVVEVNDYTAYGARWDAANRPRSSNRYLFNGKEELACGLLDYGFRLYDPSTGRWVTPDPLAGNYVSVSPYAYCLNNPVNYTDPDGMDVIGYNRKNGRMIVLLKTDDSYDQIVDTEYDRSGNLVAKMDRHGRYRVLINFIDKDLQAGKINFFSDNTFIENIGRPGRPSRADVIRFVYDMAEVTGVEVIGLMLHKLMNNQNDCYIPSIQKNTRDKGYLNEKHLNTLLDMTYEIMDMYHAHLPHLGEDDFKISGDDWDTKKKFKEIISHFHIITLGYATKEY